MNDSEIIAAVKLWVETIVIDLNLCPFAKREWIKKSLRFSISHANSEEQLLMDLQAELELMQNDSSTETTLLIHPNVLSDFSDYNQFLDDTDHLLIQKNYVGIYQIASFHPDYQFSNTLPDDVENYTNKSPYPILHLLREDSLEKAIAQYPDSDAIPERNIALLKSMGKEKMQQLLQACLEKPQR
ncbi:MAG: DUF1415 domain-containing protein [Gammaproteobacteria bacterium]